VLLSAKIAVPSRFVKLCRAAAKSRDGDDAPPIVFLKHNVYDDDEEEVTDLAKKYNVRVRMSPMLLLHP